MTVANLTIKKAAKDALKKNKVKAFLLGIMVLFSYLINYSICSCLYIIGGNVFANISLVLFNIFLFLPVLLGSIRCFWRMLCGVSDEMVSCFYYFSSKEKYKKVLKLTLKLSVKLVIYALLFNIPYIIISLISNTEIYENFNITIPLWTANLSNISVFLKTLGAVVTMVTMLKYYLAPMLIIADENMDVNEAIHMSTVISKSTTLDFIFLIFNMLGWILLSLLFIPLIFTLPYFIIVYLTHCSFAVSDYNEHIKTLNEQNFPTFTAGV